MDAEVVPDKHVAPLEIEALDFLFGALDEQMKVAQLQVTDQQAPAGLWNVRLCQAQIVEGLMFGAHAVSFFARRAEHMRPIKYFRSDDDERRVDTHGSGLRVLGTDGRDEKSECRESEDKRTRKAGGHGHGWII